MKKVLLTIALAAFAFTANAQWVIGGNIGVDHANNHLNDYVGGTVNTSISVMPKVGYWLNENMQIGMQVGYVMNYNRNYLGNQDNYNSNTGSAIQIAPYLRYNFASWKNFSVFCEAQLGVTLGLESHTYNSVTDVTTDLGDDFTAFSINVVPGLNYSLTEHISFDLYVNLLSLYANFYTDNGSGAHNWGFGANMDAQTLNAHLNNFTLGFNYAF